jgi:murein L,D-transpeptidase YcbB/YkuD
VEIDTMARLDLLLTDAFLLHASHLLAGRVNPESIHPKWEAFAPEANLASLLRNALASGKVREILDSLVPTHPGYLRLKEAWRRYQMIAARGGWPQLEAGPTLRSGMIDARVVVLRARLVVTGDLAPTEATGSEEFDEPLDDAVRRFQARHGLLVDGAVGPLTRADLNVTAEARAQQLALNLERWRWMDRDLGQRYILVNTADFKLSLVENGEIVMAKRVVVGSSYRHSPVFSGEMRYIDINPFWNVPPTIAVTDILPKVRKDVGYLAHKNIRVFSNWRDDARELDPNSIDWSTITAADFHFKLRQDPGPGNSLGRIKFMFPNRFSVYLHDTPERQLFDKVNRDFSSGCIRLEDPLDLAAYLLQDDPAWTMQALQAAVDSGKEKIVSLKEPIPIHIQYWTAWVDNQGIVQFRHDVYRRDPPLAKALAERLPLDSQG